MPNSNKKDSVPTLRVERGRDEGKSWCLSDAGFHDIGRSSENSIVLRDKTVSKRHALMENKDGIWFINDLSSKHGTFVNDEQIEQKKGLFSGDRVKIGESILVYEDGR